MKINQLYLPIILTLIVAVSCASGPETQQGSTGGTTRNQPAAFDPTRVSEAHYASTRAEVQQFIERINLIIRNRNYTAWEASLTPAYIAEISSPENLARISDMPIMRRQNRTLNNLKDYFDHVVVPARASDRIQVNNIDIEFITENRVRAFTTRINSAGEEQREILYSLEKISDTWKITN